MIQKMSSKDIMDLLEESQNSIKDIELNVNDMKSELEKRLSIIKNVQEYTQESIIDIKELLSDGLNDSVENIILLSQQENAEGLYDKYGSIIHPAFIKTPTNVFNFGTITGKIFKNNANVKINDTIKEEYTNMLMDDSITGKSVTFEEFDEPNITIEIEINPSDLLGATDFNIIELLPYIPGSFDITGIKIFTMQDYQTNNPDVASLTIVNTIEEVGASRIMIDKTRELWKFILDVHINFQNSNGKYPFGLKHLYFLKGDYNTESNIIFKVIKDKYIDWISEDIIIHDQNGRYETTCNEQNIKLYAEYNNGVFSFEIATSKGLTQNPIPRNIKEFWVSMPIIRSINSIKFKEISTRE